ncbi:tRNA adenosine deaminase-associated protein [Kineococcus rubinsiae]|uniref:tRNA adenosine deaminase-associated protein n=1 Tax=Kineococcus rubinsiae TaxID=2609562 RepID=UPI001430832E|nr:hypothetical protein [Kineococcus rubinsiae]
MAYFTAVLSYDDGWHPVDVDLETSSPDELADVLRGVVDDDSPVLAVLEREDEWFAFVRTDGAVDVRVFVSDAVAAAESRYAELFAELPPPAGTRPRPVEGGAAETDDDGDEEGEETEEVTPAAPVPGVVLDELWAGDADLLSDLGAPPDLLVRLAVSGEDPSAATVAVGEVLGFADVLESLR